MANSSGSCSLAGSAEVGTELAASDDRGCSNPQYNLDMQLSNKAFQRITIDATALQESVPARSCRAVIITTFADPEDGSFDSANQPLIVAT